MRVFESKTCLDKFLEDCAKPIGLVPTMGALHQGHISLIQQARKECTTVIVSIFVNPTQFNSTEDYDSYPRTLNDDLFKLEDECVDGVYIPSISAMYPEGFSTSISVNGPAQGLESDMRPGHFNGVVLVVTKLLNQVSPDRIYLGQKDAQQVAVITQLVNDLDFSVGITVCPTVREEDGLAISSRNVRLDLEQRNAAAIIFKALAATRDRYRAGNHNMAELEKGCRKILESEHLISTIEYIEMINPSTFEKWDGLGDCLLLVSVKLGDIRLIDNVLMD